MEQTASTYPILAEKKTEGYIETSNNMYIYIINITIIIHYYYMIYILYILYCIILYILYYIYISYCIILYNNIYMCLLIYTYILCFFHHLPKMKPLESPTGLEVVQASRTQQAFQIRQQLLQFGLLFWGAPMTLTAIKSHPLTPVGVSFLFSKQAPT